MWRKWQKLFANPKIAKNFVFSQKTESAMPLVQMRQFVLKVVNNGYCRRQAMSKKCDGCKHSGNCYQEECYATIQVRCNEYDEVSENDTTRKES